MRLSQKIAYGMIAGACLYMFTVISLRGGTASPPASTTTEDRVKINIVEDVNPENVVGGENRRVNPEPLPPTVVETEHNTPIIEQTILNTEVPTATEISPTLGLTHAQYTSSCSTFTYISPDGSLEIWDVFRKDGNIVFLIPTDHSNIGQNECFFPAVNEAAPLVDMGIRADPNMVKMMSCAIPTSLALPSEGDWKVLVHLRSSTGPLFPEIQICPQKFDQDYHYFSLCTAFKNESVYFREWIEYHQMMGVEHFYLFDNNSTDDFWPVLLPYIEKGVVTYIPFHYYKPQLHAFHYCIHKFGKYNTWMSFTDIDEFLFPQEHNSMFPILDQYQADATTAGLIIYPHNYGMSGHDRRPAGNVIDNYDMRGPEPTPSRQKMILKVGQIHSVSVHHATNINQGSLLTIPVQTLLFNHYFTKSLEDWEIRCRKGTVNGWFVVEPPYLPANPKGEQIPDRKIIEKFSEPLKQRMSKPPTEVEVLVKHTPVQ